jgi:endonuclease I
MQDLADLDTIEPPDAAEVDAARRPDLAPPDGAAPDLGSDDACPGAVGKSGRELFTALSACVSGHTSLSYNAARDAMFLMFSDPANNNTVECIYTGRKAPQVTDRASANANSLNTEHSWPQSLGASGVAMTDMHHLFPTDVAANGKRGNYPFGQVQSASWTGPDPDGRGPSKLGTRADGKTVFEPRDPVKGDLARALIYFYTRYAAEKPSGFSTSNLQIEEETLRKWNEQDPPDATERSHNEAIFRIQKNRNPYIDHPEYVGRLGSLLMLP